MIIHACAAGIPDSNLHPNRFPFLGTLTMLGEPSNRSPSGALGHRTIIPVEAAARELPSLLGMGVNLLGLDGRHTPQAKIGIITGAEIHRSAKGRYSLDVSGFLYGRDFPREVRYIQECKEPMGMSYEIANAMVPDLEAEVWELRKFFFVGAAALPRRKAAYQSTEFILV